jgi:hypothetical protein
MISRELARWHKQRHLHGQPARHAAQEEEGLRKQHADGKS